MSFIESLPYTYLHIFPYSARPGTPAAAAPGQVNGRVARQILAFAERYGHETAEGVQIHIVLTQGDLADLVGASRKRVNQAMVFFKERGLVSTDTNGRFVVHDREGLMRFCG